MLERIYRALGKVDDKMTQVEAGLLVPLFNRQGIEVRLTRSSEERIEFLTELFRSLDERGGIKEIKAALGGDDGDLDELVEALIGSGVAPPPGIEISRIRITEVPTGPAPEDVRRCWVGMEMLAVKLPTGSGGEHDFITNEAGPIRDAYAVLAQIAVQALGKRSPQAAEWFQQNLPPDLPALTFGADEVEIFASTFK